MVLPSLAFDVWRSAFGVWRAAFGMRLVAMGRPERRAPSAYRRVRRVLVAGVGNVLRGDDGFGLAGVRRTAARGAPRRDGDRWDRAGARAHGRLRRAGAGGRGRPGRRAGLALCP